MYGKFYYGKKGISTSLKERHLPKKLNLLQKRRRIEVEKGMLDNVAKVRTYIERIITNDGTKVYKGNLETVHCWTSNGSPKMSLKQNNRN